MEDWAEIRRLHRCEGMPIRAIVRKLGVGRNTVRRALASEGPPRYQRPSKGSVVDAVEPQIRALLAEWPTMPVPVIAERIGWQRGLTVLKDRVRELRPLFLPPDPVSRTVYQPGELAQCDLWFPPVDIPLGFGQVGRPPVLVMVSGYSRVIAARLIPSRQGPDLLAGHWALLSGWGRVPKTLVWDNESAVGFRKAGRPVLTEAMNAFRGTLGIAVIQCRLGDPEAKGLVERANGYLETSFLPGRRFTSPADFNTQLADWLVRANQRHHRILGCRPADRWEHDRQAMLALPPVAPVTGWRASIRLPRDHYVRLGANDYSVHPSAIGHRVEITGDLEHVEVSCQGGGLVARHQRCWAAHQSITDPDHATAAARLRQQARRASLRPVDTPVEHRELADYDRALGLDTDTTDDQGVA
ncbi:transposase [Saccharopolyspora erythraea NRRL 2338]|uniref:IS21 family transposase n=2 Tax=Saccharopolyspora erythraea (strain ATCC 11635 / DSM 40517 / JCM 4748 / NBRC 13426 / NCIMB 8594 / NRRL 2338) TaxID=405948 RepID=A4FNJ7_SACEN|nr:transposase [Saccharopolyspora erythraea NRRL 2338]CAM05622.1 IS21 family transposase [Saccharopolyspora erythraea NRRL 2338]